MAQKKIDVAYVGISKIATETELHTLPSTIRGMVNVVTNKNTTKAEKESTKKVLFGLLGISDESEVANIVNLSNEVKNMRKACLEYYPYMQANEGESKIFLSRKGCYFRKQGTTDTPVKGFYFVENENFNNIIHESEKKRKKGTSQKVYNLDTLYTSKGVALAKEEEDKENNAVVKIGYTLFSKCENEITGETYYKKWKNQPFEVSGTPAETLKLEEVLETKEETKDQETKEKPKRNRTRNGK